MNYLNVPCCPASSRWCACCRSSLDHSSCKRGQLEVHVASEVFDADVEDNSSDMYNEFETLLRQGITAENARFRIPIRVTHVPV